MRRSRLLSGALLTLFWLVAVAGCSSSADPTALSVADPATIAMRSAVDVSAVGCRTVDVRGAGAFITGGYVLTAAHVVAGADTITIRPARSTGAAPVAARLVAIDPTNDLALLFADIATTDPSLDLSTGMAAAGSAGATIVFRDGQPVAIPYTIDKPVIVRILDIYHVRLVDRPGFRVAVAIAAGDSGAVMVGADGTAVGVLYAKSRAADDRAFASDTSAVEKLMAAAAKVDPTAGIPTGGCV